MPRFESILDGSSRSIASILLRGALWAASKPYHVAIQTRNSMYDRGWLATQRSALPVISIGNLTAGGTGKTPACALFAKWFRARGIRVAILSRGYRALQDGTNDEARELESQLPDVPHLQSPDRYAMAELADQELGMQILLLDDGFQHRRLHRDLDVVLIDATEPFGYGHLLPRGLLREPIRSLRRADIVIATRSDQVGRPRLSELRNVVQRYNPKAAWLEAEHSAVQLRGCGGQSLPAESLVGRKVFAVSAIGNPKGFESTLMRYGATVIEHCIFPDHHPYSREDLQKLETRLTAFAEKPEWIVCTGKDLAKLEIPRLAGVPVLALQIEMKIVTGDAILNEHLERMLALVRPDTEAQAPPAAI
jgi:tetraacyldisaccharide 4'-kinase